MHHDVYTTPLDFHSLTRRIISLNFVPDRSLLQYGGLMPSEIHVSTRRPEILGEHKERGINVCASNAKVASVADVLVLAVPSRALKVDMHDFLRRSLCFIAGFIQLYKHTCKITLQIYANTVTVHYT